MMCDVWFVMCGAQPIDVFLLQEENEMRRVIFLKRQVQLRAENTSLLALWLPHLCFFAADWQLLDDGV